MSRLNVDKITGATGTASGAPITLSGDTATLGSGATIGSAVTGTLGTGVTFPTGHVIQTVYQRTYATTSDSSSGTSIDASHLEKSITITAGNSVHYQFNFSHRTYANSSDWSAMNFFVYHKEGSGSYANAESGPSGLNDRARIYYDESGNLPGAFYNDTNINICGIHTPSSGTVHSYKLYYRFPSGTTNTIGIDSNQSNQYVILQEIQA